jgi:hypothetical protein
MARNEALTSYAVSRAKLLLGCYRTGEANDPQTYVAAITAILARYPEAVITAVTHPATGLPAKKGWLPTVKEVVDACDLAVEPIVQNEARLKRIQDQMEARERERTGVKPTLEQLHSRFGKDWGLNQIDPAKGSAPVFAAPSWVKIVESYAGEPSRLAKLLHRDATLEGEQS